MVQCFAACTAVIAEKNSNRVKIPVCVPAADRKNGSWLLTPEVGGT